MARDMVKKYCAQKTAVPLCVTLVPGPTFRAGAVYRVCKSGDFLSDPLNGALAYVSRVNMAHAANTEGLISAS